MFGLIIVLHILVCIVLVIVVLFQQPRKGGVATVFGGGESVFGGGGAAPFMAKLTTGLAILFMVTSLGLVLISAQRARGPATRTQQETTVPQEQAPLRTQEIPQSGGE
ncbi:MAG: preprotein translocase subunit SecG [Candidatus Latescibacteria bacterium]|nr:preprotein translocase subunit SecG [Candidatus Latescibacterota bacterium]